MMDIELTQNKLINRVAELMTEDGLSALESLLEVAEENGMDEVDISNLVTGPLRHKVEQEAIQRNGIVDDGTKSTAPSIFDIE